MTTRPKISLLTIFLVALAAVTAGAMILRIRSYSRGEITPAARAGNFGGSGDVSDVGDHATVQPGESLLPNATGTGQERLTPAAVAKARQERYAELLRTAAASSSAGGASSGAAGAASGHPQPAPVVKPSLLSRLVAPVVSAFGGRSGTASTSIGTSSGSHTGDSKGTGDTKPQDPKDPNSDSVPPQLISIEFVPAQVTAGDPVTVVVVATDDNSGVRSISGSIGSPSGKAVQGFGTQRESPESNRYIGHLTIANGAEEGIWKVNFLSLSDLASNTVNVNAGQGMPPTAVLHVTSSNSDSTPPTLKNAWIEKRSMQAGDKNTVFLEVEDDKSGVKLVSGSFLSPQKRAHAGFGCSAPAEGTGNVWTCQLTMPKCLDCGEWSLEQVQMQDNATNLASVHDSPVTNAVKLNISGESCDSGPPEVRSVALDQNSVSNAQDSIVTITVNATDDSCGVSGVSGQVNGPSSATVANAQRPLFFSCVSAGDGTTWVGKITVPAKAAKGIWSVVWLNTLDSGNNLKSIGRGDPLLQGASFQVH